MSDHRSRVESYYAKLAPLLPLELSQRGDEDFWKDRTKAFETSDLLELGCGSGRITRVLSPLVDWIVAVDLSPDMLQLSRDRFSAESNVDLVRADFRCLSFEHKFDMIVATDDPFSHILGAEGRKEALSVAERHLAKKGVLLLDVFWLSEDKKDEASSARGLQSSFEVETDRGTFQVFERRRCRPDEGIFVAAYEYRLRDELIREVEFTGHLWTEEEIMELLSLLDLTPVKIWGDYDFEEWDKKHSSRMILECMRKEEFINEL